MLCFCIFCLGTFHRIYNYKSYRIFLLKKIMVGQHIDIVNAHPDFGFLLRVGSPYVIFYTVRRDDFSG
jgi:hypothetical protein